MKAFVGDPDNPHRQLVYNAIQTPDGKILESFNQHDYKAYRDKNGKVYSVDGGLSYLCYDMYGDEKLLAVYLDEPFLKVRQFFRWGAIIKNQTQYVRLCDLKDDHLDALCLYEPAVTWARLLFIQEKQLRQLTREYL